MKNDASSFRKIFVQGETHLAFWNYVSKGIGAAGPLFIFATFSFHTFGVYQLVLAIYAIISDVVHDLFAQVVNNDLIRLTAEGKDGEAKRLFWEHVCFRCALVVAVWAVLFFGAPFFFKNFGNEIAGWMRLLSFVLLAETARRIFLALLNMRLQFRLTARRAALQEFLQLAAIAYFYFFAVLGIKELIISQLIMTAGSAMFFAIPALKAYQPWKKVQAASHELFFTILRTYGFWIIMQAPFKDFNGKVRPFLIKFFLGTEAFGLFSIANTMMSSLRGLFPVRTLSTLIPWKINSDDFTESFFGRGIKYYFLMSMVITGGGFAAAMLGIPLFYPHLTSSLSVFSILLVTIPFFPFSKILNIFLVATRRQKTLFSYTFFQNGLSFAGLVLLLPLFGVHGAAVAEVLSVALPTMARYRMLVKERVVPRLALRTIVSVDAEDRAFFFSLLKYVRPRRFQ